MQKTDDLNEEQKLAVETLDGPLLVIAGAGSGKTRVVTMRISRLIELGVPASEIVALTFTNKAAEEMRARVKALVGHNLLACTFHSLGARILREAASEVGLDSSFTIYDEKDSEALLKSCLVTLNIKEDKAYVKSLRGEISGAKNDIKTPEDFTHEEANKLKSNFREVYTLYQQRLMKYNAVDFDDLLFLTVKFFQTSEMAKRIRKRYSYILVDEYQDTNHAQYMMVKFLAEETNNLCVVGDPDQSIYSWRGADIHNILNFEEDFPGAKVVSLKKNYRSTNTILKAAGALIDNNQRPYSKNLHSDLGDGEDVGVHLFSSDREEVAFVVEKIARYAKQFSKNEIVIFYRTNFQSRLFEDALLTYDIPYTIIGGLSFYMRKEIKDILSFFRLAVSPRDFMNFARTINLPKRGFGPKALQNLKELSDQTATPILHLMQSGDPAIKLNATQKKNIQEYLSIIEDIKTMSEGHSTLEEVIAFGIERTGYLTLLARDPETADERKENVEELISKAHDWSEGRDDKDATLRNFLEDLTLRAAPETSAEEPDQSIRLMTLHNSKGLEFEVCFMVGMEEDLFPHSNSRDGPEELEEERRLCYVGMTRAKKHLHLTSSSYRFIWGGPKTMLPSRFLAEIPEEMTSRTQTTRYFNSPSRLSDDRTSSESQERLSVESKEGRIVIHKSFGKGIIEKEYETSLGKTFDVKFFEDGERRSLVEKFAKLSFL